MKGVQIRAKFLSALLVISTAMLSYSSTSLAAPVLPTGYQVETLVSGFNLATTFAYAGTNEIFVAEKAGKVVRVVDGQIMPTAVYQITQINDYWDRGLLGIAVDPNFETNGYLYLSYTFENSPAVYDGPKTARIVRITYNPATGTADPASETILVGSIGGSPANPSCDDFPVGSDCIPSDSPSHSAGGLRFGPDGYLYATLGDGASFTEVDPNAYDAQNIDTLTGKVLRIDTDGSAVSTNPFFDGNAYSNRSKVYAYGIRNSYRFNFHPTTGEIYAGEVGWYLHEEINHVTAGANLGWPCREGYVSHPQYSCSAPNYVDPLYAYGHINDASNSVTGGAFATSATYGDFSGSYFFGDYSEDFIKRAEIDGDSITVYEFGTGVGGPVDIQTGPDGQIYYLSIYTGELRRIVADSDNQDPNAEITILGHPNTSAPSVATFSGENSYDPDPGDSLSFTWDFGDGSSGAGEIVSHTYQADGDYTVTLTATDNSGASDSTSLPIIVGDVSASADPEHISTTHEPIPTFLGRNVTTSTTIRNNGDEEPILVYWEIRDESGGRVHYDFVSDIIIPTGGESTQEFVWLPPVPGEYRVDVALFSNDWRQSLGWVFGADTLNVVDRVAEEINLAWQSTGGDTAGVVGETLNLDVEVKNNGLAGTGIVYVEFYDSLGQRESYQFTQEDYGDNATKTTSFNWIPQTEGTYRVALGLFSPDWTQSFEPFRENIFEVEVSDGSTVDPFDLELISADAADTDVGQSTELMLSIANTGSAGQGIVYVEFYNESGTRESYQFSLESFVSNETKNVSFDFTPQEPGEYTVALGLFNTTWTDYYQLFNPDILRITVSP